MSGPDFPFAKTGLLALFLGASLIAGCSGRDADSAERLAEINAAAARAEKAAERAEAALAKIEKVSPARTEYEPQAEDPKPDDPTPPEDQPAIQH